MSLLFRRSSVFFVLFLLCSQGVASDGPTPRRQKRGIMKMMMHIMWDPVRLIRYWYAYDVTKEIAKSWRKILPTMMLLPFNPNLADTPGIAKYVHPTHGLGATQYHKNTNQFNYPGVSSGETFSGSQFSKDYLISNPSFKSSSKNFPQASGIVYEGPQSESSDSVPPVFHQYLKASQQPGGGGFLNFHVSSFPVVAKEVDGSNEQPHHIILKPVPQGIFQNDPQASNSQEITFPEEGIQVQPVPYPYRVDFPGSDHILYKPSEEIHGIPNEKTETDSLPSSTNSNSKRTRPKYSKYAANYQSDSNYSDDQKSDHALPTRHVVHTGHQELHIVLHPIPLDNVGTPNSGQALHFVPVNFNSSDSAIFPVMFPGGAQAKDHSASPLGDDEEFYSSNNSSAKVDPKNYSHEDDETASPSSSDRSDSKSSRVTWVLKQNPKIADRHTDTKPFDTDSDGSVHRISSVDFSEGRSPLRLNGQSIDLVQLKEDLKHGTPVLIPFQKKTTFSQTGEIQHRDTSSHLHHGEDKSPDRTAGEGVFLQSGSGEQFGEKNSTQRLIFFYKRP